MKRRQFWEYYLKTEMLCSAVVVLFAYLFNNLGLLSTIKYDNLYEALMILNFGSWFILVVHMFVVLILEPTKK